MDEYSYGKINEIKRNFEKIKKLLLGQYYYLDNNAAIKEVINDRIFMEE